MTAHCPTGSGIAIGRLPQFEQTPFCISIGTEHGPVRVTISDDGGVQVTQGGKVTHVPYSYPV